MRRFFILIPLSLLLALGGAATAAEEQSANSEQAALQIQGEYSGTIKPPDGDKEFKIGVQIVTLGGDRFHAVAYPGGLPGDGWDENYKMEADGALKDGKAVFESEHARGEIAGGLLRVLSPDNAVMAELKKAERKSPTLGAKPPEGAIVLFDGKSADQFDPGKMTDDGLLIAGATSKRTFGSCQLHVEFLLPLMPEARGQGRGNSGVYLQGRYEVQVLDSFGLKGLDNECGGLYGIKAPNVNMCFAPLAWQTYDIDYQVAKFEGDKKVKNAVISVKHNGVVVHDNVELPNATRTAPVAEGPDPGPIHLQDHGNPVRYRNIWIVERP